MTDKKTFRTKKDKAIAVYRFLKCKMTIRSGYVKAVGPDGHHDTRDGHKIANDINNSGLDFYDVVNLAFNDWISDWIASRQGWIGAAVELEINVDNVSINVPNEYGAIPSLSQEELENYSAFYDCVDCWSLNIGKGFCEEESAEPSIYISYDAYRGNYNAKFLYSSECIEKMLDSVADLKAKWHRTVTDELGIDQGQKADEQ